MAFIPDTQIFTDSGWKRVEDISGRDKVLVRNFIGEAEFIQPFALKKRQYDGEIIKIGGKNWSFSVTPEHMVVYDRETAGGRSRFLYEKAEDIRTDKKNRIQRKFKYISPEDYKRESLMYKDTYGKRWVTISNYDWYVLVGYVLCRGYLEKASGRKRALNIYLDRQKEDQEVRLLGDILDRIGVEWSIIPSKTISKSFIRVSAKNSLARRLITRLGSYKRKEMFIPDEMIYTGSKELANILVETIIEASKRSDTPRGDVYQFSTNNEKLIRSLAMLGTVWGYGMTTTISSHKGRDYGQGPLKKDVIKLTIQNLAETYSVTKIQKKAFSGYVYSIDLFDGQVYVKEGSMPVWVNPK